MSKERTLTLEHLDNIYQSYAPQNAVDRTVAEQTGDYVGPVRFIVDQLELFRNIVIFLSSLLLLSSLSFTKIILYAQFRDQCPISPKIPVYLLVSGVTILFTMLLTVPPVDRSSINKI